MNNGIMGVECFNFVCMYVVIFYDLLDFWDVIEIVFCFYVFCYDFSSLVWFFKYCEIGISVVVLVSSVGIGFVLWVWWCGCD